MKASVTLENISVEGVNTLGRAEGLRDWFRGKHRTSNKVDILKNITLHAKAGDHIGLVGRNGSGKSSLLRVIAGVYPVASGTVSITGSIAPMIERAMGNELALTGRENIRTCLLYNNALEKHTAELEQRIIEFTELGDKIDFPIKAYSSGMRARLNFAIGMMCKPDILICDEVFATGDKFFIEKAKALFQEMFESAQLSFMVSHSPQIIRQFCSKCYLIEQGKIVNEGTPNAILKQYESQS